MALKDYCRGYKSEEYSCNSLQQLSQAAFTSFQHIYLLLAPRKNISSAQRCLTGSNSRSSPTLLVPTDGTSRTEMRHLRKHFTPYNVNRKAAFVLEELGLTYESVYLNFNKGEHKAPEYTKYNPNGRIPAIIDHKNNDYVLWYVLRYSIWRLVVGI